MKGVNDDIMFIPPQRSVSLYWVEKWLLAIDIVQIWCLLWIIVAPQLPHNWNTLTYPVLIFNVDVFHLYFLRLDASNTLETSKLGSSAVPRILLAAVPVGVAFLGGLCLTLGNRWVNLAHTRNSAEEAAETAKDRLDTCRRSTARVSLSRMFAADIKVKENDRLAATMLLQDMWYRVSIVAVQSRLILIVWLFAPICNAVFPVVFCADQADICSNKALLLSRLLLGLLAVIMACFSIHYVGRHVSHHLVAHTDTHHEEYVQQKEIEYMLHINDSWRIQMLWMFTSFKREWRRAYHRQSLMIVKLILSLLISLFGTELFRTQYGLAWIFRLVFPKGFRPSINSSTEVDVALGGHELKLGPLDQLLENPLGVRMRTILGCVVTIVFAVFSCVRLPFRQRSSNVLYAVSCLLLVCVSGVALALACTVSPIGVLLPANLVPLLRTIHLLTIVIFLVVCCVGVIRTLLPNSTSALVTTRANNLEELTNKQKDEDLRQRLKDMQKVKRRLYLRHGTRMIYNAWFRVATSTRLARNSMSAIWSRGSSCALDEDGALYPSFVDSPWPISFYEGRYFIVAYPQVLRALKRARNVVDRYLFADKTLVPLTILDSAHGDLQQHLVAFLSLRGKNASLSKEDERLTAPSMAVNSLLSNPQELNAALSEAERQLALFDKELGNVDEDSTDAEDEVESDALSEASFSSRISAETSSEADEVSGAVHRRRSLLALTNGVKRPKLGRRVTGPGGGFVKDTPGEVAPPADGREQIMDVAADCHRVEGVLREIRHGGPNKRLGVAFSPAENTEQNGHSTNQSNDAPFSGDADLLESLLKKATRLKGASRHAIWDPSTEDKWKSLFKALDREAADGAQKAAEVARKAGHLDFKSLARGMFHMGDFGSEKCGSNKNSAVVFSQQLHGGQQLYRAGGTVGTGLLKRQNGGYLDAIDDLLAEMEEEASEENIPEISGGTEGTSCNGSGLFALTFEQTMLPNTKEILGAFILEESSATLEHDVDETECGTAKADALEYDTHETEEMERESTDKFPSCLEPAAPSVGDTAIGGDKEPGHCGFAAVESIPISAREEHANTKQKTEKVDRPMGCRKNRKRRQGLSDEALLSHLPESARRAALEFKVRRLSTLSHLSERFRDLPVHKLFDEMHHRQSLNHAFRWILLEAFETLSGLRSEVAPVTCLPTTLPNGGEILMGILAARCRQRDQDLSLMNPKKRRLLMKLLAIQFLCGTIRRTKKRADAMIEKMLRDFSLILGD